MPTKSSSFPSASDLRASIRGTAPSLFETEADRTCGKCSNVFQISDEVFSHDCNGPSKFITRPSHFGCGVTTTRNPSFPNHAATVRPATEKQISYLRSLAAQLHPGTEAHVEKVIAGGFDRVSKAIASLVVERNAAPVVSATPVVSPEATNADVEVWPGRYTLETSEGHRTFEVRRQDSDARFAPGQLILSFLSGPDNEADYTGFAFIANGRTLKVWKRFADNTSLVADAKTFLADPKAALESTFCGRCHAVLTVPESIERGFGPECYKKGWK